MEKIIINLLEKGKGYHECIEYLTTFCTYKDKEEGLLILDDKIRNGYFDFSIAEAVKLRPGIFTKN